MYQHVSWRSGCGVHTQTGRTQTDQGLLMLCLRRRDLLQHWGSNLQPSSDVQCSRSSCCCTWLTRVQSPTFTTVSAAAVAVPSSHYLGGGWLIPTVPCCPELCRDCMLTAAEEAAINTINRWNKVRFQVPLVSPGTIVWHYWAQLSSIRYESYWILVLTSNVGVKWHQLFTWHLYASKSMQVHLHGKLCQ